MASLAQMGEVDEVHAKDGKFHFFTYKIICTIALDGVAVNGDVNMKNRDSKSIVDEDEDEDDVQEVMEVDNGSESSDESDSPEQNGDNNTEEDTNSVNGNSVESASSIDDSSQEARNVNESSSDEETSDKEGDVNSVQSDKNVESKDSEPPLNNDNKAENTQEGAIELNDSGEDVMIVDGDPPVQNGREDSSKSVDLSDEPEVINLDTPDKKKKQQAVQISPRRSSRNLNKQKSYVENDKDEEEEHRRAHSEEDDDESDIEEVLPQDPLAVAEERFQRKARVASPAIVVKDTKRLVEIAAKSTPSGGGKKEPTLVIIDTNSILSGRGPVPLAPATAKSQNKLPQVRIQPQKNKLTQASLTSLSYRCLHQSPHIQFCPWPSQHKEYTPQT